MTNHCNPYQLKVKRLTGIKSLSFFLLPLILLSACDSRRTPAGAADSTHAPQVTKSNIDLAAVRQQIVLQKGMENNDVPDNQVHFLDQKDIELSLSVIGEGLAQAGYQKPGKADFEQKIKEIYNCENNDGARWKGTSLDQDLTPASWKPGAKFIDYYSDNYGETERKDYRMVAFGNYNFIFDLDFLRNLITIPVDGKYKITLPQNIIARNRYFFDHNKADLAYLVNNDKDFLTTLVAVFGYDQVPEINGVALSTYNTGTADDEGIGTMVFANFNTPDHLAIRKGLLKYIEDHTDENNNNLYEGLENFILGFGDPKIFTQTSFKNKCKMLAYAGTLGQKLHNKYADENPPKWAINSILTNFKVQWPRFIDEIKKENYYGDADIKNVIAKAEVEAVAVMAHPDPE